MLAEGGKPLATRWAHAPTATFGMQLMQNGSNFPHYRCGIALELSPRLGDNHARMSFCRGAHLSPFTAGQRWLHSFAQRALPPWASVPSVPVSAWGASTQLLCMCRVGQSSRVASGALGCGGEKGMSCLCSHPCVGDSEPLGWSLLLSQSGQSPWRGAQGSRGIAGHSCSLWSVLSLVQQQQQCAGCLSAQQGQDHRVLILCVSVCAEVSAGGHGSVRYPCLELLPGAECSTAMETSGRS